MKNLIFIVLIAVLFIFPTGCKNTPSTESIKKIPVRLKWWHQAQFAGFYIAQKKGFYAQENINAILNPRELDVTTEEMTEELVSGKSSFAIMSGDALLIQRAKGAPIVSVAVIFKRNPYVYATLKGSTIHRPQDLIGKTIMMPQDGEILHTALMNKLDLPENKIHYIPYEKDSDALLTGKIDAQMVYRTGSGLTLENKGVDLAFIWLDEYGIRMYADTIVTTEKMIQESPDIVEKFLRASLDGWRYAIENPDAAVNAILEYDPNLIREQQIKMLQIQTLLIHTGEHQIGWMDQMVWKNMQTLLEITDDNFDINHAYTMDFLYKIYNRKH